jgi:hypothetical protein
LNCVTELAESLRFDGRRLINIFKKMRIDQTYEHA